MMDTATRTRAPAFRADTLAMHLLAALVGAHAEGRRLGLDDLVKDIGARRGDVRRTLSALHSEGYVDVLRMRPTLQGFAIGRSLSGRALPSLRQESVPQAAQTRAA